MATDYKVTVPAPTDQPQSRPKSGFRGDIQGMRAFAVLLVLCYHAGFVGFSGGFVGVDVFFVISGFLITTHLIGTRTKTGRVDFAGFYARRIQRLLPAGITVIVLTAVFAAIFLPRVLLPNELLAGAAALAYVPNMYFAAKGSDCLADGSESVFQQYWSLGVEEQFYLVWPLVIVALFALGRGRLKVMFLAVAALVLGSFALCLFVMSTSQPWAFYSLPTRAWELGVGGLVAILLLARPQISRGLGAVASALGALLLLGSALFITGTTPFPGPYAAIPVVGSALLILGGAVAVPGPIQRALAWRPVRWIGDISYSIYLVHWPLLIIPELAVGEELPFWVRLSLALVSIPVGYALYRWIEDPIRKLRSPKLKPRRVLAFALTVAVVLGGASICGRVLSENSTVTADAPAQVLQSPVLAPPEVLEVPSNLTPSLMTAADDNALVYSTPCHVTERATSFEPCTFGDPDGDRTIVVFGDSHAANWFPAINLIAKQEGIKLESYSKSSCASSFVEKNFDGRAYWECDEWREAVVERIEEVQPELVVLSNYAPVSSGDTSFVNQTDPSAEVWAEGLKTSLAAMPAASQVVVLEDTPHLAQEPLLCLSRDVENAAPCAVPTAQGTSADLAGLERQAVESSGGAYLSFNDYLCNAEECPAIIGNILVYRDTHHLTASISEFMAPVIKARLVDAYLGGPRG
ncbi:acyltransferase family protein [Pseudoclavibacter helvolus]|uniref:acyltransferase family protein n=1 Tax=Pseudoclavibacter helvolus TaxID=255205 RepID=UPI0037351018